MTVLEVINNELDRLHESYHEMTSEYDKKQLLKLRHKLYDMLREASVSRVWLPEPQLPGKVTFHGVD